MLHTFIFALYMGVALVHAQTHAQLPQPYDVQLQGSTEIERLAATQAFQEVGDLFGQIGMGVGATQLKVIFLDEVKTPNGDAVYGYFDSDLNEIHMLDFRSPQQMLRQPWGMRWTDEIAASFLLHEITHFYVITIMGEGYKKLSHAWHEAIAYDVQMELMSSSLREQVRQVQPRPRPYDDLVSVNATVYLTDPEQFAFRAYLSIQQWGGHKFLKQLINGEIPATGETP